MRQHQLSNGSTPKINVIKEETKNKGVYPPTIYPSKKKYSPILHRAMDKRRRERNFLIGTFPPVSGGLLTPLEPFNGAALLIHKFL